MGADILSSFGFVVLATIVAFNTLIYVGLTVAKAIPWPKPLRPFELRAVMEGVGLKVDDDAARKKIPAARAQEGRNPVDRLRYNTARESIPPAFGLAGGLVMMLAVLAAFFVEDVPFTVNVIDFLSGLALLVTGATLWYGKYTGRTMIRCFAITSTFLVLLFVAEAALLEVHSPFNYALLLMTASIPILIDRNVALIVGATTLLGVLLLALISGGPFGVSLFVLSASALLVGAALLEVRLRAIYAVGSDIARSEATATTDPVTGLLTRRGLLTLVPGLAANASRSGQMVCLVWVQVLDLRTANHLYGTAYVDAVMQTVAQAAHANTRAGDLIARWGQDEVIVVGQGSAPDPEQMKVRFERSVQAADLSLGRAPIELNVASVGGDPNADTFEALLQVVRAEKARHSLDPRYDWQ